MNKKDDNSLNPNALKIQQGFMKVLETTKFCSEKCNLDMKKNDFTKNEFNCLNICAENVMKYQIFFIEGKKSQNIN